jgi:hypothetical protein
MFIREFPNFLDEKLLVKIFSNLAAILVFSMQTRICQRPHFLTSLRASEVFLIAQAIVLYEC